MPLTSVLSHWGTPTGCFQVHISIVLLSPAFLPGCRVSSAQYSGVMGSHRRLSTTHKYSCTCLSFNPPLALEPYCHPNTTWARATPRLTVRLLASTELLWETAKAAETAPAAHLEAPWGREIPHFDIMHFHDRMPKAAHSQAIFASVAVCYDRPQKCVLLPFYHLLIFQFSKFLALPFSPFVLFYREV